MYSRHENYHIELSAHSKTPWNYQIHVHFELQMLTELMTEFLENLLGIGENQVLCFYLFRKRS